MNVDRISCWRDLVEGPDAANMDMIMSNRMPSKTEMDEKAWMSQANESFRVHFERYEKSCQHLERTLREEDRHEVSIICDLLHEANDLVGWARSHHQNFQKFVSCISWSTLA